MTLRNCYRATCDAPKCDTSVMSPHEKTSAVREQLSALGWTFLQWRTSVRTPGGVRTLYRCPAHHD